MKSRLKYITVLFVLIFTAIFSEERYIAVFNTLRLGKNKKDYPAMARAIKDFHLVGLVEVMSKHGVEELADALSKETGKKWEYHISPYGQGSPAYREYFAFIWPKNEVELIGSKGFYPDTERKLIRSPYGAYFRIGNFDFIFVVAHSIFGKNQSLRRAEAFNYDEVYDYFQSSDLNEHDVIVAGDFNLPADDEAFEQLSLFHPEEVVFAVDPRLKTTIGSRGLANSYDNFFVSKMHTQEFQGKSGKLDFTKGNYEYSRKYISDHLPVFIVVNVEKDDD